MQAIPTHLHHVLIVAFTAATLTFGLAQAQTVTSGSASTTMTAPTTPQLNIRDIYDRVEAAGYRDIREIELDDGRYEVKAKNAQGERIKLYVNASTGAVEHERRRK